ncbi:MAG: LysR family transcriptional regulator [Hyphomicrobiaceae bacterium]
MNLDPRHLVQLSMIVEAGAFQRAADLLAMTQPALSRNMQTLESRAGGALFDRSGRQAIPTDLGLRLAKEGLAIRDAADRAALHADLVQTGNAGELKLGVTPMLAGDFICKPLAEFLKLHPQVTCRVETDFVPVLRNLVIRGNVDIVIGPTNEVERASGLAATTLMDDAIGILCRIGHPLSRKKQITAAELSRCKWVTHPANSSLAFQTSAYLAAVGIDEIEVAAETQSPQSAVGLVASSDFLTALPMAPSESFVQAATVSFLPIRHRHLTRPIKVLTRQTSADSGLIQAFVDHITDWASGYDAEVSSSIRGGRRPHRQSRPG